MGAGQGTTLRLIDDEIELLRETRDFARWTLDDVTQLHKRFQKTHGMAITESQFDNLLLLKASDVVGSKEVFAVLDTNRDGRIDGLEFLAALVCVCRASFEEKARFAFELFDFNLNGSLSLTELALLMKSVWVGMSLLTGHAMSKTLGGGGGSSSTATVTMFVQLAQHAFDRFDRDDGASLQYEEFIEWSRSNREFMLQVEQFRVISEKAVGFEETLSLPDGSDADSDLELEVATLAPHVPTKMKALNVPEEETRSAELSPAPWMIEPTTNAVDTPATSNKYDFPPPINVDLEWIYGYTGATIRNAVRVLANSDVVYVVSKYAVVYTPERHEQRHYFGHKFPITCIDVNATATIVATGDAVPLQHQHSEIHVWNGLTLECLAVLSSFHTDSIACVAFPAPMGIQIATPLTTSGNAGKGGNLAGAVTSAKKQHHAADSLLVSIGTDSNASMALWDWQNARLLASGRAINKRKRVLCAAVSEDGHELLVAGEHFVVFHHVDGRFFKMKKPKGLETKMQTTPICVSASYYGPHTVIVGTAKGELLQFHHMQLVRVVQAHDVGQSVNVCTVSCRSMVLFTAGKGGMLKQWDSTLQPIGNAIDLHQSAHVKGLEDEDFRVHSMAYDAARQRFVAGTRRGNLVEILETRLETRVIASSHRGADIDGLATCRSGICFATCSVSDRMVYVWNMRRRIKQHGVKLRFPPSACVYSSADGGEFLAVGGNEGSIALFRAKSMTLLAQMKNTETPIHCLRFHPSQSNLVLAVACANGLIYLYNIDDFESIYRFHRFALLKPFPGESTLFVHSFDFSVDGRFLKSQHGQGDSATLRFWHVRSANQSVSRVTAMPTIRNAQWQSFTSEIGWHVSGLAGSRLSSLASNAACSVAATVDARGQLAFHHFPCVRRPNGDQSSLAIVVANAHLHDQDARASLGFALHDTLLLSTSSGLVGKDSGSVVCQWAISKELSDPQPRISPSLDSDEMWHCLASLGLENLYFYDDSYVPRANSAGIDTVLPPATRLAPVSAPGTITSSRGRSEAPDLELTLAFVHGFNHKQSSVNQILVGMSGPTGTSSSLVYGAGTLLVSLLVSTTQIKQQRILLSGFNYNVTSVVRQSNHVLAVGSHRENRVLLWQWEPTAQLLGVLRGPPKTSHVLTAFDASDFSDHHGHGARDLAAAVWYSPSSGGHVIRFYHWRKHHDQDHEENLRRDDAIQADMTRLPVLFGFFTPPLLTVSSQESNVVGFVSGGIDHVSFWWFTVSTSHVVCQCGVFGRHALVETALCGAYASPYVVTGMMSGAIVVWDNGVAAFSLPALESTSSGTNGDGKFAVMSIIIVTTKQQVVVALRSGHIALFTHSREADQARYRANTFLQRVRVVNIFDDACEWKMIRPTTKSAASDSESTIKIKQAIAATSAVQSMTVLDELQNGVAVVLSCGLVIHIDGQALLSSSPGNQIARVVLDVGQQVTAIALHTQEQWVALGNADGRVSVFDMESQTLLQETRQLTTSVKAVAWQEKTSGRLAVSLANGHIAILHETNLSIESEFSCAPNTNANDRAPKKWCSTLKFSPGGSVTTWLAAACRDYHVYVYKCSTVDESPMTCELAHDFAGHTAPIASLDFSADGLWLQSGTSAVDSQLFRWQLSEPGQSDASIDSAVDPTGWASWTVAFSGPVVGLSEVYGSAVTVAERIRGESAVGAKLMWTSRLPTLLLGTQTGRVLLGWYPLNCGDGKLAMFKEYDGYYAATASVDEVAFSANNAFAVTRGTKEGGAGSVVLFWKTDYEEELRQLERITSSDGLSDKALTRGADPVVDEEDTAATKTLLEKDDQRFDALRLDAQSGGGGDEFMFVKPWLGAIREPSVLPPGMTTSSTVPPAFDLALEFVYGVNTNATSTRNDVFYADDSWEIVYAAASFGVVYNTKTRTQLVNATHSGQMISCVGVHPARGDLVVTGEIAGGKKKPRLIAWDANSGSTITQIDSVHSRGIALLAFAPSGDRIASLGMDEDHVLAIYALNQSHGLAKFKLLAQMKTSKQPVYAMSFHFDNDAELVTAGLKHVLFWSAAADGGHGGGGHQRHRGSAVGSKGNSAGADGAVTLSMKKGLFGTGNGRDGGSSAKVLAAVYVPRSQQQSHVVTAQHDGSLFTWKARECVDVKHNAHSGAIYALVVDQKKPHTVYSAGRDGKINLWTTQLELLTTLDMNKLCGATPATTLLNSIIKSLAVRESRILFSTDGGDVAELVPENLHAQFPASTSSYKPQIHLRSHCRGELWGLATHPTKLQFATAGDDGSVRLWDAPTRSLLSLYQAKSGAHKWRALAFSGDGSHVVAGSSDGHVLVLSENLDAMVASWRCSPKGITIVKFDPESQLLAVGAHDQSIYVYDGHSYKPRGACRGHSSTVTHLDFSADGRFLQSTSSAGELLFWDLSSEFKQIPSATAVRDTLWATWTLPFGWPVQGIWPPGSDGSDVNAVARSCDRKLVATGDDFGLVKLFTYPCVASQAPHKAFAGHASHVTNCSFTRDDYYLLSTGGVDNTVCQYKCYSASEGAV